MKNAPFYFSVFYFLSLDPSSQPASETTGEPHCGTHMRSSPVPTPEDAAISRHPPWLSLPPGAARGGGATSEHISERQLCVFQHPSASLTIAFHSLVEMAFRLACVKHSHLPQQPAPPVSNSSHFLAFCFCIAL